MAPTPRPFGGALQIAVHALARDALAAGVKGTLPTNQQYLQTEGIGAGTLQRALDELRVRRALKTVSRGQLGRVVQAFNIAAAWQVGNLPPLRLALSPAGPVELAALEEVLADALTALGIPHVVRHPRGGPARLNLLLEGEADVSVFSAGVVAGVPERGIQARRLGPGTYYGPDRIAVVRRAGDLTPPRRIAVDRESSDHCRLTSGEFPEQGGYDYVAVPFPRIPAAVLAGDVDAGLWHIYPSVVPLDRAGLALTPLATPGGQAAWEELSEAVVAASPLRPELNSVLPALDLRGLAAAQAAAIAQDTGLLPAD
jgi:hypothetical protein